MKRRTAIVLIVVLAPLLGGGCLLRFREDIRTYTFEVPQLKSEECSKIILDALARAKGVEEVAPDTQKRELLVRYNSRMLALKNVEHAIADVGFDVNETKGKPEAKAALPPGCRGE